MGISDYNLPLFSESRIPSEDAPFFHEYRARQAGYDLIAGVDEAGRGPLAGPVAAAAVIIPKNLRLPGVKDSKQMTEKERDAAFSLIDAKALSMGVAVVSHRCIDEFNI